MTYAEYLAAEAVSEVRHEYLNGEAWEMAGGTPEHAALASAINREFGGVEVLSETTEGYDRGAKAAHYRRIPSLREYVLVSQAEPRIEVHRRTESGRWEILEARPGESIELASLGIHLDVAAVYANPLAAG